MAGSLDRREVAAALAPAAVLAFVLLAGGGLLAATLEPSERTAVAAMLAPRGALLLFGWLIVSLGLGALARAAYLRWVAAAARLAEEAGALLAAESPVVPARPAARELRALAGTLVALAHERHALRVDLESKVREASRGVEQERNRLAALMAELAQSVVVCNLDGRILLYNARARMQFRALSSAPTLADGSELIGLGRSIYAVLDRALVAHALESVQQRLQRGAAHPSAQLVTGTRGGQLLRVQLAPVRAIADTGGDANALAGFVLMLENITRDFAAESERDALLHTLTEGSRASLGNLQAAVEMLDFEDLDAPTRERFLGVVRDEVGAMSARIRTLAGHTAQTVKTRWPLEEMHGADLVAAACRRIEAQAGCRAVVDTVDAAVWLKVDSFSLLQALVCLAGRLVDEYAVRVVQLRLARAGARAQLDLVWTGASMSTETVMGWEADPMRVGGQTLALSVHDVVERHDGAFWFERERVRHASLFRLLLPLAEAGEQLVNPGRDMPEAAIAIHGIRPAMVADAPPIATVLPAFHAYAQDTVLVAHNAAFDMRFLELKQAATGCVFDQPVLDTLLLSAVVHPQQASHGLEAIAGRLGVPVLGRHTALGDAMVTAEVFLKLLPLLAERGIVTLGQAREAAQKTYYARLDY